MGFEHPQQREHRLKGLAAALKSPNTPAHLKPHLARLTMQQQKKPITGAKPQMKLKTPVSGPGGPNAEKQIKAPPAPFDNTQGVLKPVADENHFEDFHTGNVGGTKVGKRTKFYGGR